MTPLKTCPDDSQLSDLADGALTGRAARALRMHLETCTACRLRLQAHQALRAQATSLFSSEAPSRRLTALVPPSTGRPRRRSPLLVAGLLLAGGTTATVALRVVSHRAGPSSVEHLPSLTEVQKAMHDIPTVSWSEWTQGGTPGGPRSETQRVTLRAEPRTVFREREDGERWVATAGRALRYDAAQATWLEEEAIAPQYFDAVLGGYDRLGLHRMLSHLDWRANREVDPDDPARPCVRLSAQKTAKGYFYLGSLWVDPTTRRLRRVEISRTGSGEPLRLVRTNFRYDPVPIPTPEPNARIVPSKRTSWPPAMPERAEKQAILRICETLADGWRRRDFTRFSSVWDFDATSRFYIRSEHPQRTQVALKGLAEYWRRRTDTHAATPHWRLADREEPRIELPPGPNGGGMGGSGGTFITGPIPTFKPPLRFASRSRHISSMTVPTNEGSVWYVLYAIDAAPQARYSSGMVNIGIWLRQIPGTGTWKVIWMDQRVDTPVDLAVLQKNPNLGRIPQPLDE
jgi:hypothetical protein